MSARRALLPLGLAVGFGLVAPAPSHAGPWSLDRGQYASELIGSWYSAYTYHDPNGDRARLVGGGHMERRAIEWMSEFGWKKRVSIVFGLPYESVSRQPDGSPSPELRSASGFGDGIVGFKYNFANRRSAAALEVDATFPAYAYTPYAPPKAGPDYNVLEQTHDPVHGDGAGSVAGVLHVGTGLGHSGFVQGYGGYRQRFRDFKPQVLAGADLGFWLGNTWMIGGSYHGEIAGSSASDLANVVPGGPSGDNPTADATRHLAGPILLLRVDDRLDVFASTMHTVTAENALHTDEVRFGFRFKQTQLDRTQGFLGTSRRP